MSSTSLPRPIYIRSVSYDDPSPPWRLPPSNALCESNGRTLGPKTTKAACVMICHRPINVTNCFVLRAKRPSAPNPGTHKMWPQAFVSIGLPLYDPAIARASRSSSVSHSVPSPATTHCRGTRIYISRRPTLSRRSIWSFQFSHFFSLQCYTHTHTWVDCFFRFVRMRWETAFFGTWFYTNFNSVWLWAGEECKRGRNDLKIFQNPNRMWNGCQTKKTNSTVIDNVIIANDIEPARRLPSLHGQPSLFGENSCASMWG